MSRLMLCGVVGWLVLGPAAPVRADDAEDRAVAFVEGLGGTVTRDGKRAGKPVTEMDLSGTAVTDAELKGLAALKSLDDPDQDRVGEREESMLGHQRVVEVPDEVGELGGHGRSRHFASDRGGGRAVLVVGAHGGSPFGCGGVVFRAVGCLGTRPEGGKCRSEDRRQRNTGGAVFAARLRARTQRLQAQLSRAKCAEWPQFSQNRVVAKFIRWHQEHEREMSMVGPSYGEPGRVRTQPGGSRHSHGQCQPARRIHDSVQRLCPAWKNLDVPPFADSVIALNSRHAVLPSRNSGCRGARHSDNASGSFVTGSTRASSI